MDPESGLDGLRDVVIDAGMVQRVALPTEQLPAAVSVLDVGGLVVAPGFIDLHSHSRGIAGLRLQSMDGVTTALDLEAGVTPGLADYTVCADEGRPVNYGFAASWALCRMAVAGLPVQHGLESFFAQIDNPLWRGEVAPAATAAMLEALEADVRDGALGIGVLLGYAAETPRQEYLALAQLAAELGVPTFTHARRMGTEDAAQEAASEITEAARATGAHMHVCHTTAIFQRHADAALGIFQAARAQGLRISTEAYPYGSGATALGAGFLSPHALQQMGLRPDRLRIMTTGERPSSERRLEELREQDPAALVVVDFLDEHQPDEVAVLERALLFEDSAVASDAMPLRRPDGTSAAGWPLTSDIQTHPRTAGTFSRFLRWFAVARPVLSLTEALRRCTLLPAQLLETMSPDMRTRGRICPGAVADIAVFDLGELTDRATYEQPCQASAGMRHVLVSGTFVVRAGEPQLGALPGRPIRSSLRS